MRLLLDPPTTGAKALLSPKKTKPSNASIYHKYHV